MYHYGIFIQQYTQVDFDNIHAFILASMSTNEAELAKVNGYGSIVANDESENNFYLVLFTSVPNTLQ